MGTCKHTNCDTLSVDGAKVGIFKQGDKVGLNRLLESSDSRRLEAKIRLEVLSNFTDKALEWKFADQKLSRLLITTDLTKSNSSYGKTLDQRTDRLIVDC